MISTAPATRVARGRRPERREECHRRDRAVGERRDLVDPVAPADHEARAAAEGAARIDVKAAGVRQHRRELGDRYGAEQRVDAADDPENAG